MTENILLMAFSFALFGLWFLTVVIIYVVMPVVVVWGIIRIIRHLRSPELPPR